MRAAARHCGAGGGPGAGHACRAAIPQLARRQRRHAWSASLEWLVSVTAHPATHLAHSESGRLGAPRSSSPTCTTAARNCW